MGAGRIYIDDAALRRDVATSLGYAAYTLDAGHVAFKVSAAEPAPAPTPAAVKAAEAALRAIFDEMAKEQRVTGEEADDKS
jgi:hypothetical protein